MDICDLFQKFCRVEIRRLLLVIGTVVSIVVVFQFFALPFGRTFTLPPAGGGSIGGMADGNNTLMNISYSGSFDQVKSIESRHPPLQEVNNSNTNFVPRDDREEETILKLEDLNSTEFGLQPMGSLEITSEGIGSSNADSINPISISASNSSSMGNVKQGTDAQSKVNNDELFKKTATSNNKRKRKEVILPTSISQMNSLLIQNAGSSSSMRPRWSSASDRELLSAKLQIMNAPVERNTPEPYASLYRNISMFKRSYDLMERILKVYIYREGHKPIFHESKMNGIYASEGWFIKLMEGNKQFVVKNPKKAHLFCLPFSSKGLREQLEEQNSRSWTAIASILDNYVDTVAGKYRFWNRTGGADHFLVACHDWAPRTTRQRMKNCIRALCNSNVNSGFKIGKDTTLPVTYVKGGDPLRNLGGKAPSKRPNLAFFAGNMHGYLRPILLQYWENKEPDMKIFGPMPLDYQGRSTYRGYMKSSKYCICAKGYEVHTPRVVEAILYECVPVIIADNYVPPFFEVLNWESFAVFVLEKDIPNLRNILVSIPENKYLEMQSRVKMVQKHFLWHRKPLKFDLFHMILHSVWYNRVFQMKSR